MMPKSTPDCGNSLESSNRRHRREVLESKIDANDAKIDATRDLHSTAKSDRLYRWVIPLQITDDHSHCLGWRLRHLPADRSVAPTSSMPRNVSCRCQRSHRDRPLFLPIPRLTSPGSYRTDITSAPDSAKTSRPVALPPLSPYRSQPCPPTCHPNHNRRLLSHPGLAIQALPSEQALVDATRVVFDTQRQAGIDLPTDGELYRFDINHPDTNGMIEYFVRPMGGTRAEFGRREAEEFAAKQAWVPSQTRSRVDAELGAGSLDLLAECTPRRRNVAGRPLQVHPDQPLHASPHPPRSPLRRL